MQIPVSFQLFDSFIGAALSCPECGCTDVHIMGATIENGNEKTIVDHEGTKAEKIDREKTKRGSSVAIKFLCEWGCAFQYDFEFHKGTTAVRLDVETGVDVGNAVGLWRN